MFTPAAIRVDIKFVIKRFSNRAPFLFLRATLAVQSHYIWDTFEIKTSYCKSKKSCTFLHSELSYKMDKTSWIHSIENISSFQIPWKLLLVSYSRRQNNKISRNVGKQAALYATQGVSFIANADSLISLELLNYYLALAMRSGRFFFKY